MLIYVKKGQKGQNQNGGGGSSWVDSRARMEPCAQCPCFRCCHGIENGHPWLCPQEMYSWHFMQMETGWHAKTEQRF